MSICHCNVQLYNLIHNLVIWRIPLWYSTGKTCTYCFAQYIFFLSILHTIFRVRHDSMTQSQHPEEIVTILIPVQNFVQKLFVVELKRLFIVWVEREIQRHCVLKNKTVVECYGVYGLRFVSSRTQVQTPVAEKFPPTILFLDGNV